MTGVAGPDNSAWAFGYNLLGNKTSQSDPDTGTTAFGYDDAGNLVSTTDARDVELDYTYDLLGRKLSGTDKSSGFEFGSWLYDTSQIGQLTSSTSYVPGVTGGYTEAVTGYTSLGKPLGSKITLPASEAPLPTSYATTYTYTANDQLLSTQDDPSTAYLSSERIAYLRDALGNPTETSSSAQIYVGNTAYTDYGEPSQVTYGASSNPAYATYTYDDQTRDLTNTLISRTQAPGPVVDSTSCTYDPAGNLTSDTDAQSETGNTVTDQQCYGYDALDRLTTAWTASGSCASAPTAGAGGTGGDLATGAGSYWQTYSYDAIGDRLTDTDYNTGTGAGTTTSYVNGCTTDCTPTGVQPHTLTSTTGGTTPSTFTYDAAGNLATRTPATGSGQKLTFNDEGELSEVDTVGGGGTVTAKTSYVYDADGNELIRRDPGQTTFFAGDTEIVVNTSVTPDVLLGAVRSYTSGGTGNAVAVRSSLGSSQVVDFEFTDPHGTATLEMDATTQQVARQEFTPYGAPRANANGTAWNDPTRGFLDKPQDTATGYTDIGARKYDPTLGRFISDDPLLEAGDPQELGGYTYAADNPTTTSDPSGQMVETANGCVGSVQACEGTGGGQSSGSATGAAGPASPLPGQTGNKTTCHDAARDRAILEIEAQARSWGIVNLQILVSLRVPTASKKMMYPGKYPSASSSYGVPDIVAFDPTANVYYVWEVKSAGVAAKAVPEAQWYVNRMIRNGYNAVMGWVVGGPYAVGNGDEVVGPAEGAIIYGRPNRRQYQRVVANASAPATQASQAATLPDPTPGAVPGPYPGTAYQPGLGVVPEASSGISMAPESTLAGMGIGGAAVLSGAAESAAVAATVAAASEFGLTA